MNITQVIEKHFPLDSNPFGCNDHLVKVFSAKFENGEVEFARFFCGHCEFSYKYTDLDAYKNY